MRIIWTLLKLIIGLALVIPLGLFALAATVGVVGALIGLAIVAFKLACAALLVVGAFKVAKMFFFSSPPVPKAPTYSLPAPDPYYEEALREINSSMGHVGRR